MMGDETQQPLLWQSTASQLQQYVTVHCLTTSTNVLIGTPRTESVSVDVWAHTMCRSVPKFRVTNTLMPRILLT
jgi:hypothetical protein